MCQSARSSVPELWSNDFLIGRDLDRYRWPHPRRLAADIRIHMRHDISAEPYGFWNRQVGIGSGLSDDRGRRDNSYTRRFQIDCWNVLIGDAAGLYGRINKL